MYAGQVLPPRPKIRGPRFHPRFDSISRWDEIVVSTGAEQSVGVSNVRVRFGSDLVVPPQSSTASVFPPSLRFAAVA